jgi:hypothetical protein
MRPARRSARLNNVVSVHFYADGPSDRPTGLVRGLMRLDAEEHLPRLFFTETGLARLSQRVAASGR